MAGRALGLLHLGIQLGYNALGLLCLGNQLGHNSQSGSGLALIRWSYTWLPEIFSEARACNLFRFKNNFFSLSRKL